ncbi:MAG TPA: hypothetical protein VEK86_05885, partial [Gemmatimonadales bacterium]|nr:hypothetical protein [Gemmatimonadales bacterium]
MRAKPLEGYSVACTRGIEELAGLLLLLFQIGNWRQRPRGTRGDGHATSFSRPRCRSADAEPLKRT